MYKPLFLAEVKMMAKETWTNWIQDNESSDQAKETDKQEAIVRSRGYGASAGQPLK